MWRRAARALVMYRRRMLRQAVDTALRLARRPRRPRQSPQTGMLDRCSRAVLLAIAWLLLTGPAAGAHAVLRGSDPAAGASVARAPAAVTLRFTEAPDPTLSVVRVLDTA